MRCGRQSITQVEFDVPVPQDLLIPAKEGIGRGDIEKVECGGHRRFVDREHLRGGVRAGWRAGVRTSRTGRVGAKIAVIENRHSERAGRRWRGEGGSVLSTEPVGGIGAAHQRKVALISQVPDNIAGSCSVIIVNFDNPALVAHRQY